MASENTEWQQSSTYATLAVIAGGTVAGLVVICLICGCCTIFNRKYDHEQQKKRRVSLHTVEVIQTPRHRPSLSQRAFSLAPPPRPILIVREPTSMSSRPLLELTAEVNGDARRRDPISPVGAVDSRHCEHCSHALPVQVTRTSETGTVTSVLRHTTPCGIFVSATGRSDRHIVSFQEPRLMTTSSPPSEAISVPYAGSETGSVNKKPPSSEGLDLEGVSLLSSQPDLPFSGNSPGDGTVNPFVRDSAWGRRKESIKKSSFTPLEKERESGEPIKSDVVSTRPIHVHPLLHPHFHAHSNDDLPMADQTDSTDDMVTIATQADIHHAKPALPLQSLQLPSQDSQAVSPMSDFDASDLEEAISAAADDPCKALWGLRSVLEHRTSSKPEPVIRLIGESDNEVELDENGHVRSRTTEQLEPGTALTSLTSFESNTLSEESFDATSCAKALEAIFNEPSDLPVLHMSLRTHQAKNTTHLYSSNTHLTPPARRQQRKPSPPKLTSHQKRQSFKKAHRLATAKTGPTSAITTIQVQPASEVASGPSHPPAELAQHSIDSIIVQSEILPRPASPHRLQQMKNDSGYKSQSLDQSSTSVAIGHIHAFKSVPSLVHNQAVVGKDILAGMEIGMGKLERFNNSSLEVPNGSFYLSGSTDLEQEDQPNYQSSIVPSLTSSMEIEAAFARIPLLLTQPATPTTPPPRDWTIDERSDRLFRQFSQREPGGRAASSLRSASRPHRSILPKRKSYSPSSSQTGTPAQASIEEEEEIPASTTAQPAAAAGSGTTVPEPAGDGGDLTKALLLRSPTPDYIVCSTQEQLQTHMHARARSPELRHVPIIKLPDQECDDV